MILKNIPKFISDYLRTVKHHFKFGYYQIFCWLLIVQSIYPGKQNLAELNRWMPERILYKYMVRLLQSDRWDFLAVFRWEWQQIYRVLPAPSDGVIYVTVDKTTVEKTGKKGPVNAKSKESKHGPWKFGFHVVVLMANWGPYRFPIDFRVVRKKDSSDYKKPNILFREMLDDFTPPLWAKQVIVLGDSGFASKDNLRALKQREFLFVFSLARTWKFAEDHHYNEKYGNVKNFVNQVGEFRCNKMWFKDIYGRRRTYWIYSEQVSLNVVGDVTMIISKKRHNTSPSKAKILVTNIPNANPRDIVQLYTRRWFVECLFKELKSACGLGHHQVTKQPERIDRSVSMSLCTYLLILRFEFHRIPQDQHWSLLTLKHFFTCRVLQNQFGKKNGTNSKKKVA